jgi:glycosyltransferase involved in cell wall biosynthesis
MEPIANSDADHLSATHMTDFPAVSVVIPCRDEERSLVACLDSLIVNSYPKSRLEILIVDGMSIDKTNTIAKDFAQRYSHIRLLENPKRTIPAAMNLGILQSSGEIILKADAHSTYPSNYIEGCVRHLLGFKADMVGGVWVITPRENTHIARSISVALSHWFASGNAYIKIGSKGPRWADTAAFGCWKRETLNKLGLFDEDLAGSSDMDLNVRLRKAGGKILLVPDIKVTYFADSDLKSLWNHNLSDGVWATYVLKFGKQATSWRHWAPLAFVFSLFGAGILALLFSPAAWLLAGLCGVYGLLSLAASAHLSLRMKSLEYLGTLPIIFAARHVAHGLGALYGLVLAIIPGLVWRGRRAANA